MKTVLAVETAAREALERADAQRWVTSRVEETTEVRHRQESRGRPGANTRYRRLTRIRHQVRFSIADDVVVADARSDDCWPLITNDRALDGAQLLIVYKRLF